MMNNGIVRRIIIRVNGLLWKVMLNVKQNLNEVSLHLRKKCVRAILMTYGNGSPLTLQEYTNIILY